MNPTAPMPSSVDIPLHDIKPLVEVPDNSFILFMLLLTVAAVFVLSLLYLLWRYFRRSKKISDRKAHFKALQAVKFDDAKKSAYAITHHGFCFADDGERYKETYDNLVTRLAPYKYKKNVDEIDDETIAYYRIYVEMIDV